MINAALRLIQQPWLLISVGVVLILPSVMLWCALMLVALGAGAPLLLVGVILALFGHYCLWQLYRAKAKQQRHSRRPLLQLGLILVPLAGVALLVMYLLGNPVAGLFYYALAPNLLLALALVLPAQVTIGSSTSFSFHTKPKPNRLLGTLLKTLGYGWIGVVSLVFLISGVGIYATHDFGYMGAYFLPQNFINWLLLLILAAPGWLLLKGAKA